VPDETLFSKGDPGDALYAVRHGRIRIGVVDESGRRLTFNILGAGDVFGEIALLDGRQRTADATALEATELLVVRRRDLLGTLSRHPTLAIHLIELLCSRLRWMSGRMEEAVLLPLPARLARRLLALCEDYGADLDISQEALAVFVGATRESVTGSFRPVAVKAFSNSVVPRSTSKTRRSLPMRASQRSRRRVRLPIERPPAEDKIVRGATRGDACRSANESVSFQPGRVIPWRAT
jgi:CRP-like cAMP-binding protein